MPETERTRSPWACRSCPTRWESSPVAPPLRRHAAAFWSSASRWACSGRETHRPASAAASARRRPPETATSPAPSGAGAGWMMKSNMFSAPGPAGCAWVTTRSPAAMPEVRAVLSATHRSCARCILRRSNFSGFRMHPDSLVRPRRRAPPPPGERRHLCASPGGGASTLTDWPTARCMRSDGMRNQHRQACSLRNCPAARQTAVRSWRHTLVLALPSHPGPDRRPVPPRSAVRG